MVCIWYKWGYKEGAVREEKEKLFIGYIEG